MNDTELRDACRSYGVSYSEEECDAIADVARSDKLTAGHRYRLLLIGSIALSDISLEAIDFLIDTGLFATNTRVIFFKKFALYAVIKAARWTDDEYRFAACLFMVYLALPSERCAKLELRGEDAMEDVRMCLLRTAGAAFKNGKHAVVVGAYMSVEAKRFMVLWQLFGVTTYNGVEIGQFFACFGKRIFEDMQIIKVELTSAEISEIISKDFADVASTTAVTWAEEHIK